MPSPYFSFLKRTDYFSPASATANSSPKRGADAKRTRINIEKYQKIDQYFDRLEAADNKRANPAATRAFILMREALEEKKEELREAQSSSVKNAERIKELRHAKELLKKETQRLFVEGPQGLTAADLKAKRREQRKAASIEGLHTIFGARVLNALAGISAVEVSEVAEKAAIRQTMGYGPQSLFSGLLRIVTEVPQIRMNKGGKPKMPSNLSVNSTFKRNYKEMVAAKNSLLEAKAALRAALNAATLNPSSENIQALKSRQEDIAHAIAHLLKFDRTYENLCILLEKEFRGKKASAGVSVIAGLMSGGAYAIEPTGAGAVAGHKLLCLGGTLLQGPFSVFDYMDGNVDFPQKISANEIDLSLLIKEGSRTKKAIDLTDADIDTSIASKLYDEQPQLVRGVVRSIYTHRIGQLNSERRKLNKEIESGRYTSLVPQGLKSTAQKEALVREKQEKLLRIEQEFKELEIQIILFEQHQRHQIDPEGLIGKALIDPLFFCKKGISASVFGKVGEFWAQANQRISNNFNPMVSLGLVAIASDMVGGVTGSHVFHDGIESFGGHGPENPTAERAVIGLSAAQGVAAINSGVTVGPARFNKTVLDRKDLAAPAFISQGKGIDSSQDRQAQLKEALRNGVISKRKMKKLESANAVIEASESTESTRPNTKDLSKANQRWNRFEELKQVVAQTVQDINENWLFEPKNVNGEPMLDHNGKPIVIDARQTADCHSEYMPFLERAWVPLKGIPRSVMNSMTFWKDVAKAKRESDECREIVDNGKIVDEEFAALVAAAESFLQRQIEIDLEEGDPANAFTLENVLAALTVK